MAKAANQGRRLLDGESWPRAGRELLAIGGGAGFAGMVAFIVESLPWQDHGYSLAALTVTASSAAIIWLPYRWVLWVRPGLAFAPAVLIAFAGTFAASDAWRWAVVHSWSLSQPSSYSSPY